MEEFIMPTTTTPLSFLHDTVTLSSPGLNLLRGIYDISLNEQIPPIRVLDINSPAFDLDLTLDAGIGDDSVILQGDLSSALGIFTFNGEQGADSITSDLIGDVEVIFNGGPGQDTAEIYGGPSNNVFDISLRTQSLIDPFVTIDETSSGSKFTLINTETIHIDGKQGNDLANVTGSLNPDEFILTADSTTTVLQETNSGSRYEFANVERLRVFGEEGGDILTVQDLSTTDVNAVIFVGGNGVDSVDASLSNRRLVASGGADVDELIGGNRKDEITGGAGIDWLVGGADQDDFRYGSRFQGGADGDMILDFSTGDEIEIVYSITNPNRWLGLSPSDFGSGATGTTGDKLKTNVFLADSGLKEKIVINSDKRFLFDTDINTLYYDPDSGDDNNRVPLAQITFPDPASPPSAFGADDISLQLVA